MIFMIFFTCFWLYLLYKFPRKFPLINLRPLVKNSQPLSLVNLYPPGPWCKSRWCDGGSAVLVSKMAPNLYYYTPLWSPLLAGCFATAQSRDRIGAGFGSCGSCGSRGPCGWIPDTLTRIPGPSSTGPARLQTFIVSRSRSFACALPGQRD